MFDLIVVILLLAFIQIHFRLHIYDHMCFGRSSQPLKIWDPLRPSLATPHLQVLYIFRSMCLAEVTNLHECKSHIGRGMCQPSPHLPVSLFVQIYEFWEKWSTSPDVKVPRVGDWACHPHTHMHHYLLDRIWRIK